MTWYAKCSTKDQNVLNIICSYFSFLKKRACLENSHKETVIQRNLLSKHIFWHSFWEDTLKLKVPCFHLIFHLKSLCLCVRIITRNFKLNSPCILFRIITRKLDGEEPHVTILLQFWCMNAIVTACISLHVRWRMSVSSERELQGCSMSGPPRFASHLKHPNTLKSLAPLCKLLLCTYRSSISKIKTKRNQNLILQKLI